jgi:hypothetical protein
MFSLLGGDALCFYQLGYRRQSWPPGALSDCAGQGKLDNVAGVDVADLFEALLYEIKRHWPQALRHGGVDWPGYSGYLGKRCRSVSWGRSEELFQYGNRGL